MKRIRLKSQERSWNGMNYCNRLVDQSISLVFSNPPEFDVNILDSYL